MMESRHARRIRGLPALLYVLLAACVAWPSAARAAVIDFEGLPSAPILSQYAALGVTFNGPRLRDYSAMPGFAHSGRNAAELCFALEFCTAPLGIDFLAAQTRVGLRVGFAAPLARSRTVVLRAFDRNGVLVGERSLLLVASATPIPVRAALEIVSPSPTIRRLTLQFAGGPDGPALNNGLVVDDLAFDNPGTPPVCHFQGLPAVSLLEPRNNRIVNIDQFQLQGGIATNPPLLEATLTVAGPGGSRTRNLLGTIIQPAGGPFGAISVGGLLAPGANRVTVRTRNCRGSAEVSRTIVLAPIAAGTRFRLVGLEVVQATQDIGNGVPLVANKATIVRAYLDLDGPTDRIFDVSAAISATRPGGGRLPPLLLRSANIVTVGSHDLARQRRSLTRSLYFVLPPAWAARGAVHFEISNIFIQGLESNLPCTHCRNLDPMQRPRLAVFQPTRRLHLVLAPHHYALSNTPTPDAWGTPFGALRWLNSVYPLPGSFPDDMLGINLLAILPIDAAGPDSTVRDLAAGNSQQGGAFLDDLDGLLADLREQHEGEWADDVHLLAVTPCGCGGRGRRPGQVAYADIWSREAGDVDRRSFAYYGDVWAHEIGHNLGRAHGGSDHGEGTARDPHFPYGHGGIHEPGVAINTESGNGGPHVIDPGVGAPDRRHAHDLMSYGAPPRWISPYTYRALFEHFVIDGQARAAAPRVRMEKLVVSGRIEADGRAALRPFRRTMTALASGNGESGAFSIDLLDAAGRTLLSYRFDGQATEGLDSLSFSEFIPWARGTTQIVLRGRTGILARRPVTRHAPWLRITSPRGGESWGARTIVTWQAGDLDGDQLTYTLFYRAGPRGPWLPIAAGLTERSATIDTALLAGSRQARLRVRATDGVNTTEAETARPFIVPDKRPVAGILSPAGTASIAAGEPVLLIGAGHDAEDGLLGSAALSWTSDRDGRLGQGARLDLPSLSPGRHAITLTARDRDGRTGTARVFVTVGAGY